MSSTLTQLTVLMKAADALLAAQVIVARQHEQVKAQAISMNERSEEVMIGLALMTEGELLKSLAGVYRTKFATTEKLAKAEIPRSTLEMIPRKVAETYQVFPVMFDVQTNALSIVAADPDNRELLDELALVSGAREVKAFLARPGAVSALIAKHHGKDATAFDRFERERFTQRSGNNDHKIPASTVPSAYVRPTSMPQVGSAPNPFPKGSAKGIWLELPPPPVMAPERAASAKAPPSAATGAAGRTARTSDLPPMRARVSSAMGVITHEPTMEVVNVLITLLENGRADLRGHSALVARIARKIAERMGLEPQDVASIGMAAHLHDIGKMGAFHFTALNCAEYEGHRVAAAAAVETPLRLLETVRLPETTKRAISEMYEQWSGGGFPKQLAGKEISLGARILTVADTYSDLARNPRNPFRKVLAPDEALAVLVRYKERVFDPHVVDLLGRILGSSKAESVLGTRQRVLLLEPDPEEATILELRLSEEGLEVHIARNLASARDQLKALEFDLVVSDITFTDGDGIELLAEARNAAWGTNVAWVMLTASTSPTKAQRAFDLGALDFVSKPTATGVLVAKLRSMLEQRGRKKAGGVSGSLSEMGLPEIVQALMQGRKSGRLNVQRGSDRGEVHFLEGNIADAILGSVRGEEAFYLLLKFRDGQFALDPGFVPQQRLIAESPEMLLLEGMRRIDENLV